MQPRPRVPGVHQRHRSAQRHCLFRGRGVGGSGGVCYRRVAPAGASQGSSLWYIQLEELFPAGTPEKAEPVGAFTLEISTDVKTELYYHCRWTSVKREFSREGLRKTRKGIAMLRQEQEGE